MHSFFVGLGLIFSLLWKGATHIPQILAYIAMLLGWPLVLVWILGDSWKYPKNQAQNEEAIIPIVFTGLGVQLLVACGLIKCLQAVL